MTEHRARRTLPGPFGVPHRFEELEHVDPIRHTDRDAPVDLRARQDELRTTLAGFLSRDGDALLVAGGLRVGPDSFRYVEGADDARQRLAEATSRLRDQAEGLAAQLDEDRLAALEESLEESSPLGAALRAVRELLTGLEAALEGVARLEETPLMELDLVGLFEVLDALATRVAEPLPDAIEAIHVSEISFRV